MWLLQNSKLCTAETQSTTISYLAIVLERELYIVQDAGCERSTK